uniref:Uncharacterized protein n=1 Tax=Timema monikensis TaxID=170555 RepID=A0A7R9HMT3_9NEOP|nr:unnamed protein product [Timema monikensis]
MILNRASVAARSRSYSSRVNNLKECQGLLEENRRLQSVLEAPSHPADNHIRKVDSAILQSQVETLRWQLEQTEASREMYRAVMEQVLKFLEKVHKNLEMTASDEGSPYSIKDMSHCRVPRSRSVHTVDPSPTRSLPKTESVSYFSRAKSTAQIEESQSHTAFRDFTWRRPRKLRSDPDEVPPEKLSQEAFRLFRTVQSLLNTSEPNLAQRLSISDCGDQSSVSSRAAICGGTPSTRERHEDVGAVQDASYSSPFTDSASQRSSRASKGEHCSAVEVPLDLRSNCGERTYNASPSVGSCSSLIQESYRKSPSIKSNSSKTLHPSGFANTALTTGLEASFSGCIQFSPNYTASLGRHRKIRVPNSTTTETEYYPYSGSNGCDGDKPPEKQLSISSNEDESGFSSMSSFQEVGLPIVNISPPISPEGKANYPEIGLPLVEHPPAPDGNNANHRRWSSSPVDTHSQFHKRLGTFTPSGEKLKVLWV